MSWPTRTQRSETTVLETDLRDDALTGYNKAQAFSIPPSPPNPYQSIFLNLYDSTQTAEHPSIDSKLPAAQRYVCLPPST